MEQLQKILPYRFWILAGLALVLPLVGWACARGVMVAKTSNREYSLGRLEKDLETLRTGQHPNPRWKAEIDSLLAQVNENQKQAWATLYDLQDDLFHWHPLVEEQIRGQIGPNDPIPADVLSIYRLTVYDRSFREELLQMPSEKSGEPVVTIDTQLLDAYRRKWENTPNSEAARAAQEDIWVLSELLKVFVKINQGAPSRYEAPIQQVEALDIADKFYKSSTRDSILTSPRGTGSVAAAAGPAAAGRGASPATASQARRYAQETAQFKKMPFRIAVRVKEREIPRLLTELAHLPIPVEIIEWGMKGSNWIAGSVVDDKDPELVQMEIHGYLYLFKPPPQAKLASRN